MRRALVVLLAGFALAAAVGSVGPKAVAQVVATVDGKVVTTKTRPYTDSKVLEPLPPGSRVAPDARLEQSNTAALVLIVLVAVALLGALLIWLASTFLALEPRWVTNGRRGFAEFGWRLSNTWAEFSDWLRLGR